MLEFLQFAIFFDQIGSRLAIFSQWHGLIDGGKLSVYALAENFESAKKIALASAPIMTAKDVNRIFENSAPAIFDKPSSFIMFSGAQLT